MNFQTKPVLKIIILALLTALFFWVVDGVITLFFYRDLLRLMIFDPPRTLLESLITNIPEYNLGLRLYVFCVCLSGGGLIAWGVKRSQRYREQLEESNRKLLNAQRLARLGSWDWDIEANSLIWSDPLYRIWGVQKDEFPLTQESITALIHPDDRDVNQAMLERINEGVDVLDWEFRIIRPDGRIRHIYQNVETSRDSTGRPVRVIGAMLDITERKETRLQLQESRQRYKGLFEDSPISLWEEDLSAVKTAVDEILASGVADLGKYFDENPEELKRVAYLKVFNDVNQATVSMYHGKDRIDVIRAFSTHYTRTSLQTLRNEILIFLSGQRLYEEETVHRCVDESEILVSSRSIIPPGFEQDWRKVYVSNLDITGIKAAEEALRQHASELQALYESMTEMLVLHEMIYDKDGQMVNYRILDCNPSFSRITGITREMAVGRLADEVYHVPQAPYLKEYAGVVASGIPYHFETYYPPMEKYFDISVFSPQPGRFATVSLDITLRKQAELEIQQINMDLEHRIEERTRDLKEANAELEAFAYSISHDLRAPLRAIDGFSRILQEEYAASLNNEIQHYINYLRKNAIAMSDLVNGLLEFSRKGRQPVNLEVVDCDRLVQDVFDSLHATRTEHDTELRIHSLPNCCADGQLLKQVWVNLIDNALKFTRNKEKPMIEISGETKPDEILYTIKDNGVGFDMAYADRLFGVFQRLHRTEEFEGTGVGLAIVQRIIHRHGGRVWVDAKPGEGAAIFFTIPRAGEVHNER